MFRQALRQALFPQRQVFLELFSGTAKIAGVWRKAGRASLAFDIGNGPHHDLTDLTGRSRIIGWLKSHCACGVWLSPPFGKQTATAAAIIIRTCISEGIPCGVENPLASMFWDAPGIKQLVTHPCAKTVSCDLCCFGTPWRKATQVVCWHVGEVSQLQQRCGGKRGLCSTTLQPHQQLSGYDPSTKKLWTKRAQQYPAPICLQRGYCHSEGAR